MRAHSPGAGIWGPYPLQRPAPHPKPPPAFYTLQLQPCPLPGALHGADKTIPGKDSPGNGFALCREDVHARRQSISSPLSKKKTTLNPQKPEGEVTATPHLPAPPAPPPAANRGLLRRRKVTKEKYGRRVCGANGSWGGLGVVRVPHPSCRRTRARAPPQGQRSLPKRSFGASCAAVALPYQHGHLQYTHRSGNFIS